MDYERLKEDLMDYYGSAMFGGFPMAIIEQVSVEKMSDEEILKLTKKLGFNLNKYKDKNI